VPPSAPAIIAGRPKVVSECAFSGDGIPHVSMTADPGVPDATEVEIRIGEAGAAETASPAACSVHDPALPG